MLKLFENCYFVLPSPGASILQFYVAITMVIWTVILVPLRLCSECPTACTCACTGYMWDEGQVTLNGRP